jgi:hypothetical protein
MALSKVDYNSINVTPAASKALKWNSSANGFETGDVGGSLVLLETQTASSDSTIDFTSNIDDTYDEYVFKIINAHPASDDVKLNVNFRDGGSSYDATKTTSAFATHHYENDSATALQYEVTKDLAQGTGVQTLHINTFKGSVADASVCTVLHLFNPSSTTFVKQFVVRSINMGNDGANSFTDDSFIQGYCNVTAAIDGVQFSFDSGNIDVGTFKMYGVK